MSSLVLSIEILCDGNPQSCREFPTLSYRPAFHRARLGGGTTDPQPGRLPPSSPRWRHNWSATSECSRPRFHRTRAGGTTTGPLPGTTLHIV